VVPFKTYLSVFIALVFLTIVTVAVAQVHFGAVWINVMVAMLIASVKAGLVALVFMHLKYENPVTWLYVLFPILLLFIMIGGVFIDNPFRELPTMVEVKAN